jgi:hypothetical protein
MSNTIDINTTPCPTLPDGYRYAGVGPLQGAPLRDTIAGELLCCGQHSEGQWAGQSYSLNGAAEGAHYCVRVGSATHDLLFPAPTAPAGYRYAGVGPLLALAAQAPLAPNDLALWLDDEWHFCTYYNGQSDGTHYAVLLGSATHDTMFPAAPAPALPEPPSVIMIEDKMNDEEENEVEDEDEEGYITLHDGRRVLEADTVQAVINGVCSGVGYGGRFYGSGVVTDRVLPDDEGIEWLERENCHVDTNRNPHAVVCLSDGDYTFEDRAYCIDGEWYHQDDCCIDGNGDAFHSDADTHVHCSDGEYWPRDECHYCESSNEYEHGDEEDCSDCSRCSGSADHINEYHSSPAPDFHGKWNSDFSGWGIGFEVEKNQSPGGCESEGDYIGSTDLFAGWECDGSCGIEGITHVYDPLRKRALFEQHVVEAKRWLDAPTDNRCGGHINISCVSRQPRDLLSELRNYAPLWYAIYRNRLNNSYCDKDKKAEDGGIKYSPLRTKSFGVELRLPPAVKNGDQLLRRFDLLAFACSAVDEGWSLNRYVRACKPLLFKEVYRGDRKQYAKILRLTRHFNRWFLDGHIHESIAQYV